MYSLELLENDYVVAKACVGKSPEENNIFKSLWEAMTHDFEQPLKIPIDYLAILVGILTKPVEEVKQDIFWCHLKHDRSIEDSLESLETFLLAVLFSREHLAIILFDLELNQRLQRRTVLSKKTTAALLNLHDNPVYADYDLGLPDILLKKPDYQQSAVSQRIPRGYKRPTLPELVKPSIKPFQEDDSAPLDHPSPPASQALDASRPSDPSGFDAPRDFGAAGGRDFGASFSFGAAALSSAAGGFGSGRGFGAGFGPAPPSSAAAGRGGFGPGPSSAAGGRGGFGPAPSSAAGGRAGRGGVVFGGGFGPARAPRAADWPSHFGH